MTQLAKAKQILIEAGADLSASTDLQSFLQNTQLTLSSDANSISIDQPNGKSLNIPAATAVSAGILSSSDFTKLTELPTGSSITSSLAGKVDKVTGKGLSEEDFTTVLKDKLDVLREDSVTDTLLDGKVDKETGKGLIDPAPEDGKEYARKDGTWVEVVGGGGTGDVEEAPIDGKQYARKDAGWEEVAAGGASALADLTDVDFGTPTDGQVLTYDAATQKSKFTDPAGGGGDVEEAPEDGKPYVRSGGAWVEIDYEVPTELNFPDDGSGVQKLLEETDFPNPLLKYKGTIWSTSSGTNIEYSATPFTIEGISLMEITLTTSNKERLSYFFSSTQLGEAYLTLGNFSLDISDRFSPLSSSAKISTIYEINVQTFEDSSEVKLLRIPLDRDASGTSSDSQLITYSDVMNPEYSDVLELQSTIDKLPPVNAAKVLSTKKGAFGINPPNRVWTIGIQYTRDSENSDAYFLRVYHEEAATGDPISVDAVLENRI